MSEHEIQCATSPWGEVDLGVRAALGRARESRGLAPCSQALWAWRLANPAGACLTLARAGGDVVAGVLGVRHAFLLEGAPCHWLEVVDLFHDFERGAGLARTRALLDTAEAFAREFGGRAPERHPVLYGVPDRRQHRIGLARFKQEILRSENVLVCDCETHDARPGAGIDVEEVEAFPGEVADAFDLVKDRKGAIGVRDAEWLNWRFARHPERAYRLALARRGGAVRGYAVLRRGAYAGHEGGILADWIVPMEEDGLAWELFAWAASVARDEGADRLLCSVPDRSPEWASFQAMGFKAWGTDDYLAIRSFQKPWVMSWLFANWHYTLADSERG